ncbi:chromosomal replication initiator protein DnaA [Malonomonas rubra DSM 5091]|uniref:Chromosomal replication initiator protein DnaA n=1 Tax=Malonomonas rubra DSM 5091 TaxID=1122189 RepID=A0A1M6JU80_MALRU|nr:chromosomal replication initiator protein DnaA [Malonomonas rubra]SHJ50248.1 chromosomal replication initiator protein DnaA [Malonomonas rubra DSM 5091]
MKNIWQTTLKKLEKNISPQNFSTWIKPINFISITDDQVNLEVPNKFIKGWIKDNYQKVIEEAISDIGTVNYRISISINDNPEIREKPQPEKQEKTEIETNKKNLSLKGNDQFSNINKKYTFESFVSGPSNQFAHAAAMAVANNPATTYNPLFIYGGVGLGKTHIVHAIGNEILNKNNNLKICYYSSEKFTNELINSLRHAKMDEFRNKFRSIDVLLIDDIQFIAGKKSTQEEFFHTFNALYESHKQIVVTSDKFPKEIPDLEERLRSRFEWGLIADIQAPDIETKQAILKMKADQNNIELPEDVSFFLANSVISNVRELEGYLIRIGAFSSLTSTPINLEMAKNILKDIIIEQNKEITVENIQKTVATHYQIKTSDLKSSKRLKTLVLPRQVAMYISRKLTSSSYPEIGTKFGGKDHSTIIHAIKKIEKNLEEDLQLRTTVEKLINSIKP